MQYQNQDYGITRIAARKKHTCYGMGIGIMILDVLCTLIGVKYTGSFMASQCSFQCGHTKFIVQFLGSTISFFDVQRVVIE